MLGQAKTSPDITNYLTYIFANGPLLRNLNLGSDDMILVRSSAALNLKNTVRASYTSIPAAGQAFIQASTLACLQDPNPQIRNLTGSVITEVVSRGGVLGWPALLPELFSVASNERGNTTQAAQEGAMGALAKVCEDNKKVLDQEYQGQRPLEFIIPKLLAITQSQLPKVRAFALASLNAFIPDYSQSIQLSLEPIMAHLFNLANDDSNDVRRNVCRSFVHLVDVAPDKIRPHMGGLVDYMVLQQRNTDDPELALEAAEFWLCVGEDEKIRPSLGPYLSKIVPILLESMVYDEEDILRLEGDEDDADVDDRAEDVRPQFAKTKIARPAINGQINVPAVNGQTVVRSMTEADGADDLSEGEIEDDDDDDDVDDVEDRWNLRKCSAATLDVLASNFHEPIFEVTLPYLKENLQHHDWPYREAAVLAIGAVADGCMETVTPHLPELVPYLISLLNDDEATVRVITCWSLGRYSAWASKLQNPADTTKFFEPMIQGILSRMLDKNKRVQQSAVSAFAVLEEKATSRLTDYCAPIVQQFVQCFRQYKDRNMFVLYDCVQTLAEHVGPALARPEITSLLMPAIMERWQKVSDQSQELFPMLECLSYVATALRTAFREFAQPIFQRCVRIVHSNLEDHVKAMNDNQLEKPNKDFLVTSLDLLSAIIQALGDRDGGAAELVRASQPRFFDLLMFCTEDANNEVRQSSYALLGDCAVNVFFQLRPFLSSIIPILIKQLDLDNIRDEDFATGFGVINNACWSCGEIAIKEQHCLSPHVEKLYYRFIAIIKTPEIPQSVHENAAIALGRLGCWYSDSVAPHLGEFAQSFLHIMRPIDDSDEKTGAIYGFNMTVQKNPRAMETCLLDYFQASTAFRKVDIERHGLEESFQRVSRRVLIPADASTNDYCAKNLVGYKSLIPNFEAFIGQLPPDDQSTLRNRFKI